jgi:capsid protein
MMNPFLSQNPEAKARRLARALISDLVVYNPERRQQALQNGTLKEVFEEEIRKSWEEYSEQVGKDTAESTPFFTEALNEILAGGKKVF